MQISDSQQAYLLSDIDNDKLYSLIKTQLFGPLEPNGLKKPVALYLAGQPGSGKTVLRNHLLSENGLSKSTLTINTDELREYHPQYRVLMADAVNYSAAPNLVNPDSVKWSEQLRTDAIKAQYNLLFDVTLGGNPEHFIRSMKELKGAGYDIKIAVLAVKPELSRLGIHLRYERQLEANGTGRFVKMVTHDYNYRNLTINLNEILAAVPVTEVSVFKRKIHQDENNKIKNNAVERVLHYDNLKNPNQSINGEVIIGQIEKERNRPWTKIEKTYLAMRVEQVEKLIANRGGDLDEFRENIKPIVKQIEGAAERGI